MERNSSHIKIVKHDDGKYKLLCTCETLPLHSINFLLNFKMFLKPN